MTMLRAICTAMVVLPVPWAPPMSSISPARMPPPMDLSSGVKPSGTGWYCETSPSATLPARVLQHLGRATGLDIPDPGVVLPRLPPMVSSVWVMALGCCGASDGWTGSGSRPICCEVGSGATGPGDGLRWRHRRAQGPSGRRCHRGGSDGGANGGPPGGVATGAAAPGPPGPGCCGSAGLAEATIGGDRIGHSDDKRGRDLTGSM